MLESLNYGFIQNAIIAGVLVSFISGIIGSLVVVNRMVFLAGGIAHAAYGGVGIAIFFGVPIFLGASLFALLVALIISYIAFSYQHRTDTIIGLIWAIGMAIGIILIDLTPGYNVDMMSYLFGSILAVEDSDLWYMAILLISIITFLLFYYKEILAISYDSEFAAIRGIKVRLFYTLLLMMAALSVVVAIRVVGLILVIALLSIPTYIAERISDSLLKMMILSGLLAAIFTLAGLYVSYTFDLTSGATIILVSACGLLLFLGYERAKKN